MPGSRSLLVVADGATVWEERWDGGGPGTSVNVKSAAKSLLSALVGIALERGHLRSLEAPVLELLPEAFQGVEEAPGRALTLRHLLTMTAGLESTSGTGYGPWVASPDWVRYVLTRRRVAPPGELFIYSTGSSHLLSAILTRATGQPTRDFARQALLEPLGIEASWSRDPQGIDFGGNELRMTPRALARFGQLYLQGGEWAGQQLVPAAWIQESRRRHAEGWPDRYGAYGYLWWLPPGRPGGAYMAMGYGGQVLYVAPERALVVVVTSTLEGKGVEWDRQLLGLLADLVAAP
ncbi:MAG: serine hydrolase domain-containing protein [Thermoanaerobaculia bacterium]